MKLDYGTQLSPDPIKLSVGGKLVKPTLSRISQLTFSLFNLYEMFVKCTPEEYYTKLLRDDGNKLWDEIPDDQKSTLTMYDLIIKDVNLQTFYTEIFEFFFEEHVAFIEGFFILFEGDFEHLDEIPHENIRGVISDKTFPQVLEVIQQVCCIYDKEDDVEEQHFKNSLAKKLFEKMRKAAKEQASKKKADPNFTIPNIISKVSARHPSLNLLNIWNLTIFQLMDTFASLQSDAAYEIDKTRVSVWGDEKKQFDPTRWYKNTYDNELPN